MRALYNRGDAEWRHRKLNRSGDFNKSPTMRTTGFSRSSARRFRLIL